MKKIALLPVAALLIMSACSKDDEVTRPVPNDPIVPVQSVADDILLNAPAQKDVKPEESLYRVAYANNQEIVYEFLQHPSQGYVASVKKIEGQADIVIIPSTVSYQDIEFTVNCIDLYVEGIADVVTSLTLPKTAVAMLVNDNYIAATGTYLRQQFFEGKNLTKIELESGFSGFCSIKGAVYSADLQTLVCVPQATSGVFTVAESTTKIDDRAFYYCRNIDVINIPAGVTEIGDEAVVFTNNLLLVNCQAVEAPEAVSGSFGTFAHSGVLRVPSAGLESYKVVKPDLVRPVEPEEPADDASDEEWDKYNEAFANYSADKKAYDDAWKFYHAHAGWDNFVNIEGVTF